MFGITDCSKLARPPHQRTLRVFVLPYHEHQVTIDLLTDYYVNVFVIDQCVLLIGFVHSYGISWMVTDVGSGVHCYSLYILCG